MSIEFKLPDIGEGLTEGEIVKWLVKEGDSLKEDQPMVEVMTDKANVEIPSPAAGVVQSLLAKEGQVVPVGTVIIVIGEAGAAKPEARTQAPAPEARAPKSEPRPVGNGHPAVVAASAASSAASEGVLAAPATRKLARTLGVDLGRVRGTGPNGRITPTDVEAFAKGGSGGETGIRSQESGARAQPTSARPLAPAATGPREERIPLRGLRRKISEKMVKSKYTAPHFTYVDEVDMTEIVRLREAAIARGGKGGPKISFLAFVIQALVPTLREFPMLNASLDDERQEIVVKRFYNIGIATATEEGLTVPVVKDADRKDIYQLSADILRLSEAARARKVSLDDLKDGTFTITSTGNIGGLLATPIINHPEVAILGVHKIKPTPVVRDGQIVVRQVGHLSISLDHRVVDGAVGAAFMNRLIEYLEHPGLLTI